MALMLLKDNLPVNFATFGVLISGCEENIEVQKQQGH